MQASRGLGNIHAALLYLDEERIGGHAALEAHLDGALVEKAVGVGLQRARHADGLCLDAVTIDGHGGRCRGRVVCHEVEGHLLVLPSFDGGLQVVVGENCAVGGNYLRTDVWGVGCTPQYIQIYAVRAERERRARLHLRHHLHRVPSIVKPGHGEVEAAVGGAASGDGLCVALLAIDIEGHHLGARTTDGERYVDGLATAIATLSHALCDVKGGREGERDRLDGHVGLLGLRLACQWVCGGGDDIDVGRAELQVLGEVELVAARAHILDGVAVDGGRTEAHLYLYGGLLSCRLPFLVT